ncbi:hypothetical protein [Streptomyces hokutonensis]|uniref:Uncharacterized protein n=1 Tax=Streptomyces hokutonensis TaxID=1306990 RepID=A0ABW6ML43_9ACTN
MVAYDVPCDGQAWTGAAVVARAGQGRGDRGDGVPPAVVQELAENAGQLAAAAHAMPWRTRRAGIGAATLASRPEP